jgi:chromosomal replication initiation ATPase DnaA
MFLVAYQRTMAGAKMRLGPPAPKVRTIEDIREERRLATLERNRREAMELLGDREAKAKALAHARSEASRRYRDSMNRTPAADIIGMVAAWHDIPIEKLISPSRSIPVCAARIDAMVAVYVNCRIAGRPLTLTDMGRIFRRDHSTVHWSLQKAGLRV